MNNNINFDSELQNNKINQLLDYLPESTLENISKLPEDKKSCVICLSNYEIGEKVKEFISSNVYDKNKEI